jgi:beta-glucosidase
LYIENIAPAVAAAYGEVVHNVEEADLAILRLQAPFEQRDGGFLERLFHAGDLDFKEPEKGRILAILARVPTIVDIYLDRPAVIPEIAAGAAGLLANFGAHDAAVLDVIFGRFAPSGKLPFELPSSMEAVRRQREDVPYDSEDPLFPFGHGLRY